MKRIIIVHGPRALPLAEEIASKESLPLVNHADHPLLHSLRQEDKSFVLWGPLYEVRDGLVYNTELIHSLPKVDIVYRQTEECSLCQIDNAQLQQEDEVYCTLCMQDMLDRKPPILRVKGDIVMKDEAFLVSLSGIPLARRRKGITTESLVEAITSLDDALPGSGIRRYVFKPPRSLTDDFLATVEEKLKEKQILVLWEE